MHARARVPQVMGLMGAKVEWSPYSIKITGPGAIGQPLKGIDHDCNDIPDAAMTLAVAALFAEGCVLCPAVLRTRQEGGGGAAVASQETCHGMIALAIAELFA